MHYTGNGWSECMHCVLRHSSGTDVTTAMTIGTNERRCRIEFCGGTRVTAVGTSHIRGCTGITGNRRGVIGYVTTNMTSIRCRSMAIVTICDIAARVVETVSAGGRRSIVTDGAVGQRRTPGVGIIFRCVTATVFVTGVGAAGVGAVGKGDATADRIGIIEVT